MSVDVSLNWEETSRFSKKSSQHNTDNVIYTQSKFIREQCYKLCSYLYSVSLSVHIVLLDG